MEYRQIIKEAWAFTQNNKRLMKWYAFVPALISTIVSLGYFTYQYYAFKNSILFTPDHKNMAVYFSKEAFQFLKENNNLALPLIIAALIFGLIYLFYPTIAQGALVQIIARKRNKQPVQLMAGIGYGLRSLLPLFEFHAMLKVFSVTAILSEAAFILRNLGVDAMKILLPVLFILLLIGMVLALIFTYTELYIVIDRKGVFDSMRSSTSLVLDHWQHTVLILILLMIIGLRVIFNIFMVLIIPILIFGGVGLIASVTAGYVGMGLAVIVALVGLYLSGYLGGTLTVFSTSVWTFTFLELTENGDVSARDKGDDEDDEIPAI